jgi:hypothetical protein
MISEQGAAVDIDPSQLGTLNMDGIWASYIDLDNAEIAPARIRIGADEYAWESSIIVQGHSAVLPQHIRDLRASGKKTIIAEREERYYVYVSPP